MKIWYKKYNIITIKAIKQINLSQQVKLEAKV